MLWVRGIGRRCDVAGRRALLCACLFLAEQEVERGRQYYTSLKRQFCNLSWLVVFFFLRFAGGHLPGRGLLSFPVSVFSSGLPGFFLVSVFSSCFLFLPDFWFLFFLFPFFLYVSFSFFHSLFFPSHTVFFLNPIQN